MRVAGAQLTIMVSPISLLVGGYFLVMFAWPVAVNTLLGVFLQTPVEFGGYGFTPEENSYCKAVPHHLLLSMLTAITKFCSRVG
jgi:hypothetical protein